MSEHTGGTVTYHRAEYHGDDDTWRVWFRPTGGYYSFSGAEGEAMGLTPPEPAPLVVTCNGHSIELSDLDADVFQRTWAERATYDIAYDRACDKLAGLLRDARQDPQPASDDPSDDDELPFMSPRQHLEALLAGRDDADELIEYAARHWVSNKQPRITHPQYVLTGAIGDAARGGA